MNTTMPDPKYEAYVVRRTNVGVQVHAFKQKDAAERAASVRHSIYALQLPEGKLIALVGSIESARAILPGGLQEFCRPLTGAEMWFR